MSENQTVPDEGRIPPHRYERTTRRNTRCVTVVNGNPCGLDRYALPHLVFEEKAGGIHDTPIEQHIEVTDEMVERAIRKYAHDRSPFEDNSFDAMRAALEAALNG